MLHLLAQLSKNFGSEMNLKRISDLQSLVEHQNVPEKYENLCINKYFCAKTSKGMTF